MKKEIIALAATAAACIGFAATPAVVWDGNFTVEHAGFTLNRSGNALSEDKSTITIDQDVGVKVDFATGFSDAMTVMFKYSDLSFDAQKTIATSFCSGGDENRTGVYLASGGTANGIWNTADWAHPGSALSESSGVFAFSYNKNSGTGLYYIDSAGVRTQLFFNSGLKASGDSAINGCAIGGERAKTGATLLSAATGMKITGIAIFNGVLTESEMTGYYWPSELQAINISSDTSVSAINAQFDSANFKAATVSVANGVTIAVDTPFSAKIISVSSAGSITLSAASQPDASYFSAVDFSGVQGALLRSWLTPGVVGVNFAMDAGNAVADELVTSDSWVATTGASGNSTALFADGLTKIRWSSSNTYSYSGAAEASFLHGYLDDGGNGVEIYIDSVPYETYDVVIYASTDTQGTHFRAKTVNGVTYTMATGSVGVGDGVWGTSRLETPVYGANAMRVKNLVGPLTIYGGLNNGSRGGIAAIQIMPTTAEDIVTEYTLSLAGGETQWSEGAWKIGEDSVSAPLSGYARITFSSSATLRIDDTVALTRLVLDGADNAVLTLDMGTGGSFVAYGSVVVEGGVLKQGSAAVLGTTTSIVVEDGATFDLNGLAVSESNSFYIEGDGAGNWPWALTSSGGGFPTGTLRGFTLTGDATIGGANKIGCGKSGAASYLGLGTYTLTKTGAGELSFTNIRTASGSEGTFDIAGGSVTLNEFTNLDGSNLDNNGRPWASTAVIIRSGASLESKVGRWVLIGSLDLDGGTITTTSNPFSILSALTGAGTLDRVVFDDGAVATLSGNLSVTTAMTLSGAATFNKDANAASDVVVDVQGTLTASGSVSVGAGVTFNLGTNRPTAELTIADDATLSVKMLNSADVVSLSVSAQPANLVVYDENGDELDDPRVTYSEGTLTIMAQLPTLSASGAVAFDTAANWNNSIMPVSRGDAIIELSGDAEITVSSTYILGNLTITGSGTASFTFTRSGEIQAANISLKNGARFVRTANISATAGIAIDSGTVLRLNNVTEAAAISGAGAVETYGTVVLESANTMTGGITVKPGSALSTAVTGGYGEYSASWAYSAQRQVVVEDGGTVDINNVANNDGAVALTIAGKGILSGDVYSGAVTYSGASAITSGSRQISSLVLTGDALVDVGAGWGLVHSGWGNARLGLNGHTLTVRGTGTFPVVNVNKQNGTATTGTLVLDGAELELSNVSSNLAGVDVIAKGCATINIATAPSAIGSLTVKPSSTGTTASNWNLPSSPVPKVDASNIDVSALSDNQVLTIFTAPSELFSTNISVEASGRFTTAISGTKVTLTFKAGVPDPFLHYDFDSANSIASDSAYNFGNLNPAFSDGKNSQAGVFDSSYKPYYGSNSSGKSPFHAGEMTVTTLLKVKEANNTILWNLGNGWGTGVALIAKDSSTIALVSWTGGASGSDVVSVSGVSNLMNKWHLVTIVTSAEGTTLYVDKRSASVDTLLPSDIDGKGQFGSIHGTAKNYTAVAGDGYLLDDWRIYDCALTHEEINDLRWQLNREPLFFLLR